MTVYVIYNMSGDYAHAIAISTNKDKAEYYAKMLNRKGITPYIEEIEVDGNITELLCD